jgi:hypothetical protein
MPLDPTTVPLRRPRIPLAELLPQQEQASAGGSPLHLHPEALLVEEFAHAGVVAYQAHEQLTGLLTLCLLLLGVITAGVGVTASAAVASTSNGPLLAVSLGLVLAAGLNFGCFTRLLALFDQYHGALRTRELIEEVYEQHLGGRPAVLERASRWRLEEVLSKGGQGRFRASTLFSGLVMVVIGSGYLGVATELLAHATHGIGDMPLLPLSVGSVQIVAIVVDAPVFLLACVCYVLYYRVAQGRRAGASSSADA